MTLEMAGLTPGYLILGQTSLTWPTPILAYGPTTPAGVPMVINMNSSKWMDSSSLEPWPSRFY
jgi:hypothetical protein